MSHNFLLSGRNSPSRKHQRLLFTCGITKVCYETLIDHFIADIRVCHPEMWKAVACTLHIKPCQTKTHTTTICKWVFWNSSSRSLVVLFCMTKGIRDGPRSISRCRDFSLSLSIRMIWLHEFPLIWNTRNVLNGLTILSTKACLWNLWNLRFLKNFCLHCTHNMHNRASLFQWSSHMVLQENWINRDERLTLGITSPWAVCPPKYFHLILNLIKSMG